MNLVDIGTQKWCFGPLLGPQKIQKLHRDMDLNCPKRGPDAFFQLRAVVLPENEMCVFFMFFSQNLKICDFEHFLIRFDGVYQGRMPSDMHLKGLPSPVKTQISFFVTNYVSKFKAILFL